MVVTTYLTKKKNPQVGLANVLPNQHELTENWYKGIDAGIIFHDELSDDFMKSYPKVKFFKVSDYSMSANDERFVMFLDLLESNPQFEEVWFTDLFDVTINSLPKIEEKTVYVQTEETHWKLNPWAKHLFQRGGISQEHKDYILGRKIYNPGVWGGKRDVVMPVLRSVIEGLYKLKADEKNLNMFVFNIAMFLIEDTKLFKIKTGFPLHSKFKQYEVNSKAHFIHK